RTVAPQPVGQKKAVLLGAGGVGKVGAAKICIHKQFSLCNGIGPPQDQGGTGGQHSLPAGSHRLLRLPQAAVLAVGQHLPAARGQQGAVGAGVGVIKQKQFGPAAAGTELLLRSEEHTSELQSRFDLVCRLLLKKKKKKSSSSLRHLYHISDTCTYSISGNEMR